VDARPFTLYERAHISGAVNIPLALFDIMYMMELSELKKDKQIIVYGRTVSSYYDERVARKLILRGHKNIGILKGGLSGWRKKGYAIKSRNESDPQMKS
jgi:3-mercaptopyruvate sulfurtransferase SseA